MAAAPDPTLLHFTKGPPEGPPVEGNFTNDPSKVTCRVCRRNYHLDERAVLPASLHCLACGGSHVDYQQERACLELELRRLRDRLGRVEKLRAEIGADYRKRPARSELHLSEGKRTGGGGR